MKIAIVSGDDVLPDDSRQLSAALVARGQQATVYLRQSGRRSAPASADGCRALPTSVGPGVVASAPDALPYVGDWAATLARVWSSDPPDVVHAYGWLGGLAAQLAARRQQIPTVQSFLGLAATSRAQAAGASQDDRERERIEPLLARSATWVTGECAADVDVLARLRRGRARVSTLTCGVDVDRYTPVGPALGRATAHRILCQAPNPLWHNGFDIAIGALAKIPNTELVIAETDATNHVHDEARARLRQLATELGTADRVNFAGTITGDELPVLMRSVDVFVCTPRCPPRPAALLQAMASGRVVVTLAVGVLSDAVVDNVTGLLLSPESPGGLAAALRSLLAQSFQCESMGAAGRSRALSRFCWDRIALDSLNVYGRLVPQNWVPEDLQPAAAR